MQRGLTFMFTFKSRPESIRELELVLERMREEFRLDEEIYANMLISLTEAVNNAMIHGNNLSKEKIVKVNFCKGNQQLNIRISDEGEGFNVEDIPDPTNAVNIEKLGGRGVFLIHQLCDQVKYINNGSTVEISFNL